MCSTEVAKTLFRLYEWAVTHHPDWVWVLGPHPVFLDGHQLKGDHADGRWVSVINSRMAHCYDFYAEVWGYNEDEPQTFLDHDSTISYLEGQL